MDHPASTAADTLQAYLDAGLLQGNDPLHLNTSQLRHSVPGGLEWHLDGDGCLPGPSTVETVTVAETIATLRRSVPVLRAAGRRGSPATTPAAEGPGEPVRSVCTTFIDLTHGAATFDDHDALCWVADARECDRGEGVLTPLDVLGSGAGIREDISDPRVAELFDDWFARLSAAVDSHVSATYDPALTRHTLALYLPLLRDTLSRHQDPDSTPPTTAAALDRVDPLLRRLAVDLRRPDDLAAVPESDLRRYWDAMCRNAAWHTTRHGTAPHHAVLLACDSATQTTLLPSLGDLRQHLFCDPFCLDSGWTAGEVAWAWQHLGGEQLMEEVTDLADRSRRVCEAVEALRAAHS